MASRKRHSRPSGRPSRSWDGVAAWYTGWVGAGGSEHHRPLAVPAILDLLALSPGEHLLDLGCGPGVLAPHAARAGARYTGVDASPRLLAFARRHHGNVGRFVVADATVVATDDRFAPGGFDAVSFLLSVQDIDPLDGALCSAAWSLRPGGRVAIVMTHPCFRVPRQSGWGWDASRRLQYRRVDRYLTRLDVPMKQYDGARRGATRSYHRPLAEYINGLSSHGLLVDRIDEIPGGDAAATDKVNRAELAARREIPLFLGIRAVRSG
jgi:SAM-dependent methyltransferase